MQSQKKLTLLKKRVYFATLKTIEIKQHKGKNYEFELSIKSEFEKLAWNKSWILCMAKITTLGEITWIQIGFVLQVLCLFEFWF